MSNNKILVDLDGTLAHFEKWDGEVGAPIPAMVERVHGWLQAGWEVVIFTARVGALHLDEATGEEITEAVAQEIKIKKWLLQNLGRELPITAVKTFDVIEVWDDRAVRVTRNTGESEVHLAHDALDLAAITGGSLPERVERLVERCAAAECDDDRTWASITYYDLTSKEKTKYEVAAVAKQEGIMVRISSAYRTIPVHDARFLAAQLLRAANEMEDRK